MFKKVDKSSHIPVYHQVEAKIHKKIKNGYFKPDDKLLS